MSVHYTPVVLTNLLQKIDERLQQHVTALSLNAASDFPDYRYRCGQIQGLREVIDMAEETRKLIMES